jgi:hypothetical protein
MSEWDESMERMRATGRGRRLTLAPRTWAPAGGARFQTKVSEPVFADSDGEYGEMATDTTSGTEESETSSVGSWSVPVGTTFSGSRLWALANGASSDEEEPASPRKIRLDTLTSQPNFAAAGEIAEPGLSRSRASVPCCSADGKLQSCSRSKAPQRRAPPSSHGLVRCHRRGPPKTGP